MPLIAKKVNFSRGFCEMIIFKTPTAWDRLDTTVIHAWSSAHSFLSESHTFQRGKFFKNSTSNLNRIFRCTNTFVPRCCTWVLGSGVSYQIFCSCVDVADGLLDHYQNYFSGFKHLCYPPNIKSHSPKFKANTR